MYDLPTPRARPHSARVRAVGLLLAVLAVACLGAAGRFAPVAAPASRIEGLAGVAPPPPGRSWAPAPIRVDGLSTLARADASGFALRTAGGPATFLPGINLGSSVPGHQPGELPATAADYREWFTAMGWLGIRVVRVYTIHPPEFYTELVRHNESHPDRPLYLVQGVYLPDESYVYGEDLYDPAATAAFTRELRDAVAATHGRLRRDPVRGRAHGIWTADASPWLVAWIAGVEWDPHAIRASDALNGAAPAVGGRYFRSTVDASPTERWIAARLDELATAQAADGRSMPIGFVNWPTTDPLRHPEEPQVQEDLVGVDANHVLPTANWPGGAFASYHAYPYYPDFQRHEPALQEFVHNGRKDPYAGYLDALRRHHAAAGLPVVVSEFGVPSAIGLAHYGTLGRHQGGHSEAEAMRMDADMLGLIQDLGLAGGFVFALADEWFKFTWNTISHQIPAERRQLWHDALTNEQHFGLIANDPNGAVNPDPVRLGEVTARVDEAYIHLRFPASGARKVTIGFDTIGGESAAAHGTAAPGAAQPRAEAAFALDLGAHTGEAWIRADLDPVPLDYYAAAPTARDGWQRYRLNTNRDLVVPSTGERLPAEFVDVGVLRYGHWDPREPGSDSRALWYLDGSDAVVRVPWALAGFADPSSKAVLVPKGREPTTVDVDGVGLVISRDGVDRYAGRLTWDNWQRVGYSERLKTGATAVRDAMVRTAARGERAA
jgi:hypothetical protein